MKKINFLAVIIGLFILSSINYLIAGPVLPDGSSASGEIGSVDFSDYEDFNVFGPETPDKLSGYIENGDKVKLGTTVGEGIKNEDILLESFKDTEAYVKKENEETKVSGENDFSLKIKNKKGEFDEYTGFKKGEESSIKLDKTGKIIEADLKINDDIPEDKGGSDLVVGNMKFNAPEKSRVLLNKDLNTIQVDLKEGTQISKEPKKADEEDEENMKLRYLALKDFVKLPDSIAEQLGFSGKEVLFKGILSHNGNNWFLDENHDFDLKIDGKIVSMANLNGMHVIDPKDGIIKTLNGINPTSVVFFSKESFNKAVASGYKGAYFVLDSDGVGAGSNNNLDGNSLKLGTVNPWDIKVAENGHVAGVSMKNSNFFINKNSEIITKGNVIIDDDYIYYKTDATNEKLFFGQGSRVPGFGDFKEFKDTTNSPLKLFPFNENGNPFPSNSKVMIGMSTDPNPFEPTNFKMIGFEGNEAEIGRVSFGKMPVDSGGKAVEPVKSPEVSSDVPIPITPKPLVTPVPTPEPKLQISPQVTSIINSIKPSSFVIKGTQLDMFKSVGPNYDPNVHTKGIVLEFSSRNCGPCRLIAPHVHNLAKQNPNVKVIPIDGDLNSALLRKYNINQYPTVVRIDPNTGNLIDRASKIEELNGFIKRILR